MAGIMEEDALDPYRSAFGCGTALAQTIAALAHTSPFAPGQQLYPLDDRAMTTLIIAGLAQEVAYGRDGAALVLYYLRSGQLFGSLLGHGGNTGPSQIEALSAGHGAHFSEHTMLRLMESYSCVAVALTRQLSERLATMRQRMVESVLLSATGRICAELLRLAQASDAATIRPVPVFTDLAAGLQTTRETVSRTISQLEKRGILQRCDGGLRLIAPHRLEELIY